MQPFQRTNHFLAQFSPASRSRLICACLGQSLHYHMLQPQNDPKAASINVTPKLIFNAGLLCTNFFTSTLLTYRCIFSAGIILTPLLERYCTVTTPSPINTVSVRLNMLTARPATRPIMLPVVICLMVPGSRLNGPPPELPFPPLDEGELLRPPNDDFEELEKGASSKRRWDLVGRRV